MNNTTFINYCEFIDYQEFEEKIYKTIFEHPEEKDSLLNGRSKVFKYVMVTPKGAFILRADALEGFAHDPDTGIPNSPAEQLIIDYIANAEAITSDIFQG